MGDYAAVLDGIVHEPTQATENGFDLTAAEIYTVSGSGRIDFGGGELTAAGRTPHESAKRRPNDDYEWWTLDPGTYLLEYNESIADSSVTVALQPRRDLLERGATHPTLQVPTLPRVPLTVGGAGIKIKANARVSTLVDLDGG